MTAFQNIAPDARAQALNALRARKMARSAHAFVRGSTAYFYQLLARAPLAGIVPKGPPIWICGDCHLGNLGPVADREGKVSIEIRDLDQAVIGNPAHDLIRLALSLQTAARSSDLPGLVSARMIEAMMAGYESGLHGVQPDPEACSAVRTVREVALGRHWKHLARERIDDTAPEIPIGRRFWPLRDRERGAIGRLIADPDVSRLMLPPGDDHDAAGIRVLDAAYWRKGCSSLGALRFAVLAGVRAQGHDERLGLIDIKQAAPSVAPRAVHAPMPRDPAACVVAAARALSPALGERMCAASVLGRPVIVRELKPQDLKIEIEQFGRDEAIASAHTLAGVVGTAHARQMDQTTRKAWLHTLAQDHGRGIDVPSWLWRAVVHLAGAHEVAYLEHCRRVAFAEAA